MNFNLDEHLCEVLNAFLLLIKENPKEEEPKPEPKLKIKTEKIRVPVYGDETPQEVLIKRKYREELEELRRERKKVLEEFDEKETLLLAKRSCELKKLEVPHE